MTRRWLSLAVPSYGSFAGSGSHSGLCDVSFAVPWAPGGSKWARNPPVPEEVMFVSSRVRI